MANTTFSGAVRSKNGLKTVSQSATTGAITEQIVASSEAKPADDIDICVVSVPVPVAVAIDE